MWIVSSFCQESYPVLENYRGVLRQHSSGTVTSFLGIPYAHPPTGNLRFSLPKYMERNGKDVVRNATKVSAICMQPTFLRQRHKQLAGLNMSEDCLTLNIYLPFDGRNKTIMDNPKTSVVVYIHAGDYVSGAGAMTDGEKLSLQTKSIVVSVNYRLGIFGFYTFNKTIPGNLGLLDIVTALKWVNNRIHLFGGDADSISVLSGHHTLMLLQNSHIADGLFHRGISFDDGYFEKTQLRSKYDLKIYNSIMKYCSVNVVVQCLRGLSTEILQQIMGDSISEWQTIPFQPIVDGYVIEHDDDMVAPGNGHFVDQFMSSLSQTLPRNSIVSFWIDELQTCSREAFYKSIQYLTNILGPSNKSHTELLLKASYYPKWTNDRSFCTNIKEMFLDLSKAKLINYADKRSKFSLTFLLTRSAIPTNATKERDSTSCVLDDNCTAVDSVEDAVIGAISSFILHG